MGRKRISVRGSLSHALDFLREAADHVEGQYDVQIELVRMSDHVSCDGLCIRVTTDKNCAGKRGWKIVEGRECTIFFPRHRNNCSEKSRDRANEAIAALLEAQVSGSR